MALKNLLTKKFLFILVLLVVAFFLSTTLNTTLTGQFFHVGGGGGGGLPISQPSGQPSNDFQPCASDSTCTSGLCRTLPLGTTFYSQRTRVTVTNPNQKYCLSNNLNTNALCYQDEQCRNSICKIIPNKLLNGAPDTNKYCLSRVSNAPYPSSFNIYDYLCIYDEQCNNGICRPFGQSSNKVCHRLRLPANQPCYYHEQCTSEQCNNGQCTEESRLPTVTLTAAPAALNPQNPSSIAALEWNVQRATTCTGDILEGDRNIRSLANVPWIGEKNLPAGIFEVRPTTPTLFRLTCSGQGGTITRDVRITILSPPSNPQTLCTVTRSGTGSTNLAGLNGQAACNFLYGSGTRRCTAVLGQKMRVEYQGHNCLTNERVSSRSNVETVIDESCTPRLGNGAYASCSNLNTNNQPYSARNWQAYDTVLCCT